MIPALFVLDARAFELVYGTPGRVEIARQANVLADPMTSGEVMARPELLAKAEVIFSGWGAPLMDEAFLAMAPKLRAIFYGAGSIRYFTTDALWEREIVVTSAGVINAIPVSEFTLASVIFGLKRAWHHMAVAKKGRETFRRLPVPGAHGSKVGIVSLGIIGRLVRDRIRALEVEVLAYDPFISPARAAQLEVRLVGLEQMFAECDVVTLHTPWLKETEGMISGRLIESMKLGSTLINTARGALVRENELIIALNRRPDLTAVLDVTWPEPPVAGSPLYSMPNVVLTPHIAGSMDRECRRMGRAMIDEFGRWQRGEPLKWRVEREQATLMA